MTTFPYPKYDPGTVLRENKRYFGKFSCDYCARWWQSGNSWLGSGQNCTGCGELTFPWKLSYLKAPPITAANEIEKRHPQENCERCKRLGYYCRDSEHENVQSNRERTKNRSRNRNRNRNKNRRINKTNRKKSSSASTTTPQTIKLSPVNSSINCNASPTTDENVVSCTSNSNDYSTDDDYWGDRYYSDYDYSYSRPVTYSRKTRKCCTIL